MKENEMSSLTEKTNGKAVNLQMNPLFNIPMNEEETLAYPDNELNEAIKIKKISDHFKQIMLILGLDLEDDSLKGTPGRVAKMYVKEMFSGLNPENAPEITLFDNNFQYTEMLVEKNIALHSCCEHHFVPIIGKVHVGYFSSGKVIGLSKINRVVQFYSKRPQLQERLTEQIARALGEALKTTDVAVVINAAHMCVTTRGVTDTDCKTTTSHFSGKFKNEEVKKEFFNYLKLD